MGDLNALDLEDVANVKVAFNKFIETNPSFKERSDFKTYFIPAVEEMCRGEVIKKIKEHGLLESIYSRGKPTFPTPVFLNIPKPLARIDHLFYTFDLKISKFEVLTGGVFDKASDHYPIIAEL